MRSFLFAIWALILAPPFVLVAGPAAAQSATAMESVLKNSKLVSTNRDLHVSAQGSQASISTYCDSRSHDRDCKITALLMLKELLQHFKSIQQARVFFYDQYAPTSYRAVSVTRALVEQVDRGGSPEQVLASVPITHGSTASTYKFSVKNVRPGAFFERRQQLAQSLQALIDQGGNAESDISQFARLESLCGRPRPDQYTVVTLYNQIAADIHKKRMILPPKKRPVNNQAQLDKEMTAVREQLQQRLNNGEGSDVPSLLKTIQDTVVKERRAAESHQH